LGERQQNVRAEGALAAAGLAEQGELAMGSERLER
jgi:hypothetical protein